MDVVAGRFELERVAGQGGMGTVFRALDRETGRLVAVKLVEPIFANARFEREAQLLAELEADTIVRYVDHGKLDDGRMYLAMEWLEGDPLDVRLAHGALPLEACLEITQRIAAALAAAHARGIVHRDVKPANVILEHGEPARARLVDFGIARAGQSRQVMTATGAVLGTPAYMAPEQARGLRVEPPADIFSLGCVVFECLCGRPAFVGEHAIAVLAKILLEAPPRPSTLRPETPPWLEAVVERMLAKDPDARFADAGALRSALEERSTPRAVTSTIGIVEARMSTVVLAKLSDALDAALAPTEDASGTRTVEDVFTGAGARFGLTIASLANGSLVGVASTREGAVDAAERAARCALAIATAAPAATVAIATGRAVVSDKLPVGGAIDAAARLLSSASRAPGVFLDEPTAALLASRFALVRDAARSTTRLVHEERERAESASKSAPLLGRDRELASLEATFRECVEEPVAQGLLVVAPPGIGKSRIRLELVERARASEERLEVWLGLADPFMVDAPFALLGDVLRRVLGIFDDEPLPARREKVLARVSERRAAAFIGEVAGAPFDDADEPALRAARNNPGLLASQLSDALGALARSSLAKGPLLVVLEDVHWADAPSLRLFGALVGACEGAPFMLFGLARPTVDEVHPRLWMELRCQRIELQPLLKKAAVRLARTLLGADADVDAIVERAGGNALFVEELVRAKLAGRASTDLPPTIAAAAESRLLALAPEIRLVLRAGAVFGERFWQSAVRRLVGVSSSVEDPLAALERMEIVTRSHASRFGDETEFVFRHALLRDAAYAMLTEADRRIAHAAAAEWLEARIDDAVVLAHHYEEGGRAEDAARWLAQAAEEALVAGDLPGAVRDADRAIRLGAAGHVAGRAVLVRAYVHFWHAENREAQECAERALETLERSTRAFFDALGTVVAAAGKLEDRESVEAWTRVIEETQATDVSSSRSRAVAMGRAAMQLFFLGAPDRADVLIEAAKAEPGSVNDPVASACLLDAAFERSFAKGYGMHPSTFEEGVAMLERMGDHRSAVMIRTSQCVALAWTAGTEEARASLRRTRELAKDSGAVLSFIEGIFDAHQCAENGDYAKLETLARNLRSRSPRLGGAQGMMLALIQAARGDRDLAERTIEGTLPLIEKSPPFHALGLGLAARLALQRGDVERAVSLSEASLVAGRSGVAFPYRYVFDVSRAEVLAHVNDQEGARDVLEKALASVRENALIAAEYRRAFLERRPDVRMLVELARARGHAVDDLR